LDFIFYTISGGLILFLGAIIHHFVKDSRQIEEEELEIEQQKKSVVEKN